VDGMIQLAWIQGLPSNRL